jgi:hypothetical protein
MDTELLSFPEEATDYAIASLKGYNREDSFILNDEQFTQLENSTSPR